MMSLGVLRSWSNFGQSWKLGGILNLGASNIYLVVVAIGVLLFDVGLRNGC